MAIVVVLFFISVSFIQLTGMIKNKLFKESIVYSIIMLISFVYALGIVYDWNLPTISKITIQIFKPISDAVDKIGT